MRFKVQSFAYNDTTHDSMMIAATKYGLIKTECSVHPADEELANQWDGYRFCEYKAAIEYMRHRTEELKAKYKGILNAHKTILDNLFNSSWTKGNEDYKDGYRDALYALSRQEIAAYKEWQKSRKRYYQLKEGYHDWCQMWLNERTMARNWKKKRESEGD